MNDKKTAAGVFGTGPLFAIATRISGVLVVTVLMIATNLPIAAAIAVLGMPIGPVVTAVAAVLVGPSAVAAFTALRRMDEEHEAGPARSYLRSLRGDLAPAVKAWLPPLIVLAVIETNLAHLDIAVDPGFAPALRVALLALSLAVAMTGANALLIVSRFRFRTRDTLRLAVYLVGASPRSGFGVGALLVLTTALLAFTTVFVLPLISGLLAFALLRTARPMLALVEERFTRPA